jgi:hypothetical protein
LGAKIGDLDYASGDTYSLEARHGIVFPLILLIPEDLRDSCGE